MHTLSIPAHWATMPEWFKTNDWLQEHQTSQLAKKMVSISAQIAGDMSRKHIGQRPMQATRESFMGDVVVNAIKHQYAELLKAVENFTGDDKVQAVQLMEQFKAEYPGYILILEEKVS